ncbi:hypothetical protein PEBR_31216 [Penicillium brasilianum]|uniref:Secreted protein CSS2 C-terminal domain-containing protein n=1 Tax=Penicillium brasilianum TaxID=104259 RepID=A0A1S9RHR2_PENBI|nr:hypothetical protein PEBR_31216 [Penicillium brasilianum]
MFGPPTGVVGINAPQTSPFEHRTQDPLVSVFSRHQTFTLPIAASEPIKYLAVTFDLVNANYVALCNDTTALTRRTGITTTVAAATVLAAATSTIIAGSSVLTIYEFISDAIKSKSNPNSSTMTYGTDSGGTYFEAYAYEATTSGSNCDTTAEKKTILAAVETCANHLHTYGAVRGCCTFSHGGA